MSNSINQFVNITTANNTSPVGGTNPPGGPGSPSGGNTTLYPGRIVETYNPGGIQSTLGNATGPTVAGQPIVGGGAGTGAPGSPAPSGGTNPTTPNPSGTPPGFTSSQPGVKPAPWTGTPSTKPLPVGTPSGNGGANGTTGGGGTTGPNGAPGANTQPTQTNAGGLNGTPPATGTPGTPGNFDPGLQNGGSGGPPGNGVGNAYGFGNGNGNGHGNGHGHGQGNGQGNGFGNGLVNTNVYGGGAGGMNGMYGGSGSSVVRTDYASLMAASLVQGGYMSAMTAMHLSDAQSLQSSLNYAVRRENSRSSSHQQWVQQQVHQALSQPLADTFAQMNRQNMLAFTRSPGNAYGPSGPTSLLSPDDNATLTRMMAASIRDYNPRSANFNLGNINAASGSLSPHSVLAAYGFMHADRLGPEWLAMGIREIVRLAQGAGPQEADAIYETLAYALMMSALTSMRMPQGANRELALAQTFASMQLAAQMQDTDALPHMFSRLGSMPDRMLMLGLIASLNPQAKLAGLDTFDSMAMLFKSVASRGAAGEQAAEFSKLSQQISSLGTMGFGPGRLDGRETEQLRREMLEFIAMQPKSFYMAETTGNKQFHSQRMEAVLQLIVQQILSELAAKAGRLARLRSDFADSIELLSNLLDLLSLRDEERNGESSDENEQDEDTEADDKEAAEKTASPRFDDIASAQRRKTIEAEYYCQHLFRVVPDKKERESVTFQWEDFYSNPLSHLPRQMDTTSPVHVELKSLGEHARGNAITSVELPNSGPREVLAELLMPGDADYALGAAAAGTTIMARHWHCKMWAHDLAYRLNFGQQQEAFDFSKFVRSESSIDALPRAEPEMRVDLLRMLQNSQDRWVREQAQAALVAGMRKLATSDAAVHETKGETVRSLRTPMLRDATIYFLSRYYFKLKASEAEAALNEAAANGSATGSRAAGRDGAMGLAARQSAAKIRRDH
jgi:hypothetical protein